MSRQVQEAYIVAATRTPVGKAPRGMYRNTRPDDLLAHVLKSVLAQAPSLDPASIGDVIRALNLLDVTPRDLIGILQAIKAAGALQAELTII